MCSSKQLHREFNAPADCLANMDTDAFMRAMQYVVPGGVFVRLDVPAHMVDLSVLLAWTSNVSALRVAHSQQDTAQPTQPPSPSTHS
jgi:hypothetical protein